MKDGRMQITPEIGDEDVLAPHGPIDPELTVLYVEELDGNAKGAIVNYACHPNVVKGTKFSGDWPSVVSYNLKDKFGRDFVSLFLNGTCGNINHVDVITAKEYPPSDHYIKMGNVIAKEAIKAIGDSKEIKADSVSMKKSYFDLPAGDWDMEKIEESRNIVKIVKPVKGLTLAFGTGNKEQEDLIVAQYLIREFDARKDSYRTCVGVAKIGDCYLYTVPCERFVQFGLQIKENSQSEKTL